MRGGAGFASALKKSTPGELVPTSSCPATTGQSTPKGEENSTSSSSMPCSTR